MNSELKFIVNVSVLWFFIVLGLEYVLVYVGSVLVVLLFVILSGLGLFIMGKMYSSGDS